MPPSKSSIAVLCCSTFTASLSVWPTVRWRAPADCSPARCRSRFVCLREAATASVRLICARWGNRLDDQRVCPDPLCVGQGRPGFGSGSQRGRSQNRATANRQPSRHETPLLRRAHRRHPLRPGAWGPQSSPNESAICVSCGGLACFLLESKGYSSFAPDPRPMGTPPIAV